MKIFLKITIWLVVLLLLLSGSVCAHQPDAPFLKAQEKNKDKWAKEDQEIDQKLAALKQKFGKTPNIIYILADDVGWGELGW